MKRLILTVAAVVFAASSVIKGENGSASGTYVEARTAEVFAGGCVMNSEAGTAGREAILAWRIDQGSVDGVSLDGLSVVAAVTGDMNLGIQELGGARPTTRAAVYVDQRATEAQQVALLAMARKLSNGIVDAVVDVTPTPIEFTSNSHIVRVAARDVALDVNKHMDHEMSCGASKWFNPLSSVGEATIGMTGQHSFTGSSLGTKWSDPNKNSAFFGTFTY